ncbi:hypothetical protein ACHAXR_003028 [Thalassiosira sp. AJA248-18]
MTASTNNPSFEPPNDDSDNEIWLLRAPAHLDVSALLNGATLDVLDPQSLQSSSATAASNNTILSRFKSDDNLDYALALGDATESDNLRLLVPTSSDDGDDLLMPHRPFHRQVHLTSVMSGSAGDNSSNNTQATDLTVAPAKENAPKPAFDQSGKNGSVDSMRHAYVPVPQRQGLMRRWAMPGSKIRKACPSAIFSEPMKKKARGVEEVVEKEKDVVVSDDEQPSNNTPAKKDEPHQEKVAKSSSKKNKKDKKKKEKKSKKSRKTM